jgi:hypothetical protein
MLFTDKSQGAVAYSFSWEADFAKAVTDWGRRSGSPIGGVGTLDISGLSRYTTVHGSLNYPTILDHSSPAMGDDSFTTVGNSTAFVYVVVDHNILRRRVVFMPGPPPPPAPAVPPIPRGCHTIQVSGAGLAGISGVFELLGNNRTSDGAVMYSQADGIHQIYRYRGTYLPSPAKAN